MDNYRGQREVFSCDFARRNGAENVSDIVECFELFSDKEIKLKMGRIIARHSGPVTVLKWSDKRNVTMVSTYHSADTQRVSKKGKETEKPLCMMDYNLNMGGVDLKDQLLHMYMVERKRISKWHLRLCKRPLNSAVLNSVVVYRQVTGRYTEQLSCRIRLVEGLFTKYAGAAQTRSVPGRHASDHTVPRLTERYFLRKVAAKTAKSKLQGKCIVCSRHGKKKRH